MNVIDCVNLLTGKEKSLMQPYLETHLWKLARVFGAKSLRLIRSEKCIGPGYVDHLLEDENGTLFAVEQAGDFDGYHFNKTLNSYLPAMQKEFPGKLVIPVMIGGKFHSSCALSLVLPFNLTLKTITASLNSRGEIDYAPLGSIPLVDEPRHSYANQSGSYPGSNARITPPEIAELLALSRITRETPVDILGAKDAREFVWVYKLLRSLGLPPEETCRNIRFSSINTKARGSEDRIRTEVYTLVLDDLGAENKHNVHRAEELSNNMIVTSEKLPSLDGSVAVMNPPFSMIWEFIGMALEREYAAIVAPHTTLVVPAKSKKNAQIQEEFKRRLESFVFFPKSVSHFGVTIAGGFIVAYTSPTGPKDGLCRVSTEESSAVATRDMKTYVSPDDVAQGIFDKTQAYINQPGHGTFNEHSGPRDLIRDPYGVGSMETLAKLDGTGSAPVLVSVQVPGRAFERKYFRVDPKHITHPQSGYPWGITRGTSEQGGVENNNGKSKVLCPPIFGNEGDAFGYTFLRGGCQLTAQASKNQAITFCYKTNRALIKMICGNADLTRRLGDKLPWFDPTRPWSEKEIQDELGLNPEERQWIEDHIEASI